jgi:hypothetical protein
MTMASLHKAKKASTLYSGSWLLAPGSFANMIHGGESHL